MTTLSDSLLVIVGIVILLLAVCLIPLSLQIWRAAKGMSLALDHLNQSLPSILKNIQEITTSLNQTTTTVHRQIEDFSLIMRKIQGTIVLLGGVEEMLRRNFRLAFVRKIKTSVAVVRGIQVFIHHLLKKQS